MAMRGITDLRGPGLDRAGKNVPRGDPNQKIDDIPAPPMTDD
jgi:hypothetical protein